jgi:hypothetical protein
LERLTPHHVKSKLAVGYQLGHLPETAGHIPDTEPLHESSLKRMMAKYDKVYLKPDRGRKSKGVIRIERLKDDEYKLRQETRTTYVKSDDLMARNREAYRGSEVSCSKGG